MFLSRILPILVAALPASQAGTVLFSNFGPGMIYGDGGFIGDAPSSLSRSPQAQGMMFTPSITAQLSDIILPLLITTGTDQFTVFLDADNNDQPGTTLEQINVTPSLSEPQGGIVTATSILHPLLVAGTPYWIVVGATSPNTEGAWYWNSVGDNPAAPSGDPSGTNDVRSTVGPTGPWIDVAPGSTFPNPGGPPLVQARDTFEVDGVSSVPEPRTVVLSAIALSALARLRARRRARTSKSRLLQGGL